MPTAVRIALGVNVESIRMQEEIVQTSPDGQITLAVVRTQEDLVIGFLGYPWHTHADLLAQVYGLNEDAAVSKFIHEITNSEKTIAVLSRHGEVVDAWVTDDHHQMRLEPGETLQLRLWDGTPVQPGSSAPTQA
jgi:hypothetical protein